MMDKFIDLINNNLSFWIEFLCLVLFLLGSIGIYVIVHVLKREEKRKRAEYQAYTLPIAHEMKLRELVAIRKAQEAIRDADTKREDNTSVNK